MSRKVLLLTAAVCVLFIVDGCELNAVQEPGPEPRRGQSFLKRMLFWVQKRLELGLELS